MACPKCPKCGAPLTTALMAAFCPLNRECEFWPEDGDEFLRWVKGEISDDAMLDAAMPPSPL